jgi:hypothetical protein
MAVSPDPEMMDDSKIARFAETYDANADTQQRQILEARRVQIVPRLGSMWTSLHALSRGPHGGNNPVADDLNALLLHQPDATITFGVAEADPLYGDLRKSHFVAQRLLNALTVQRGEVKVIMIPGMSHAYNTYFPSLYHAVKRYGLGL